MVAVIIDDGDAVHLTHLGKATVHTPERGKRVADLIARHPKVQRHRHSGQRVGHVMIAWHRQDTALNHTIIGL